MDPEQPASFAFWKQPPPDLCSLTIEGERVLLRSVEEHDGPDIFHEFTSEITRFMFPKPPDEIEGIMTFISQSRLGMQAGHDLLLTILKKENNEFLGVCGFHGRGKIRTPELGLWIKRSAHGHKYGSEAIHTLITWAVGTIDFDYLVYPVDRANIASCKIPESLGGAIIAENKVMSMSGILLDEVVYKIVPSVEGQPPV